MTKTTFLVCVWAERKAAKARKMAVSTRIRDSISRRRAAELQHEGVAREARRDPVSTGVGRSVQDLHVPIIFESGLRNERLLLQLGCMLNIRVISAATAKLN